MATAVFLQAGTSLESSGRSIQDIYEADIAPKLAAAPQGMFPVGSISFEAFRRAADMVQTRAFHMKADNWLTGASQVGCRGCYFCVIRGFECGVCV